MKHYKNVNGRNIEMTEEEATKFQRQAALVSAERRRAPLAEAEILHMLLKAHVNSLDVDDSTALRMKTYYPDWEADKEMPAGSRWQYNGNLYRVNDGQSHTSQNGNEPTEAPELFTVIEATCTGTIDDPIPYRENMELEAGKHYMHNSSLYECKRNTDKQEHRSPSELGDHYLDKLV